jgi:hypothetical protein
VSDVFNYSITDGAGNGNSTIAFAFDFSKLPTRTDLTFDSTLISTSTDHTASYVGDITTSAKVLTGTFTDTVKVTAFNTVSNFNPSGTNISAGNTIMGQYGSLISIRRNVNR